MAPEPLARRLGLDVAERDGKKRINITIGPAELARARQSGETVSGYISRLIRKDGSAGGLWIQLAPEVEEILHGSGVLESGGVRSSWPMSRPSSSDTPTRRCPSPAPGSRP